MLGNGDFGGDCMSDNAKCLNYYSTHINVDWLELKKMIRITI